MKTCSEVSAWCAGASAEFGDPSVPVCQLFFRWQENLMAPRRDDELVCGMVEGELVLLLGPEFRALPMPIELGDLRLDDAGGLEAYGAYLITAGVWALRPSLNVEETIHGFVVLHGVPDPAPWERRIVLP